MVPTLALALIVGPALGNPPADPYAITPEAGPWVICAASYMNEEAPRLAHLMAEQLRSKYGLQAYVFDRGDAERQQALAEHKKKEAALGPDIHLPFRHPRFNQSCAVLIGGFADLDAANAALSRVRKLKAPELTLSNGQPATEDLFELKPVEGTGGADLKRHVVDPLERSFVVRNPTAPVPKNEGLKIDPAWKELNASESFSLLKNPKTWTLVVKEYNGSVCMQDRKKDTSTFLEWLTRSGHTPGEGINAAGFQAHHLAEFLRDKRIGFDAYVLHTRTSSIVTVGGFDGPEDPEMARTKERLEKLSFRADPRGGAAVATIKGDPIGLFVHPLPMEVPHF
jgi:hypothetical protein